MRESSTGTASVSSQSSLEGDYETSTGAAVETPFLPDHQVNFQWLKTLYQILLKFTFTMLRYVCIAMCKMADFLSDMYIIYNTIATHELFDKERHFNDAYLILNKFISLFCYLSII